MYFITYKNILKTNKGQDDYIRWLLTYWPIQQEWGATSFRLWNSTQNNTDVLLCRYAVKNIETWNEKAASPEAKPLIQALSEIVDLNRMSIKITLPPN
jgi:hypothetical protein